MTDPTEAILPEHEHLFVEALRVVCESAERGPGAARQVTQAAAQHGIVIPLYRAYLRGDLEAIDGAGLVTLARRRRASALKLSVSAVDVSNWLQLAGVRHAIVKGPAIAVAYIDNDREFVDLDVLVAPKQMSLAIATLEAHGAWLLDGLAWPRPDGIGEVTLGLNSGITVDLHADLIHRDDVRRDFELSAEDLLDRATTARILGRQLPVLDPEDNLIHVAMHAMIGGGDRLVWLIDLDALVRHGQFTWPKLLERSRDAHAALVVGVMLERAKIVLGTPVPRHVLRALQKRGAIWALLMRSFERSRPTASNYGRSLHGQVLVRATRKSTVTSLATLGRLIWKDVVVYVLTDPHHPWRGRMRQWRRRK